MRIVVIGAFVGFLALIFWYRWLVNRRRARADATTMAQAGPILPTIRLPNSGDIPNHLLPPRQSYLGENLASSYNRERREPPPAYHGKEPLEGETVISSNAPPADTETPPAYMTPMLTPLPPAYVHSEVSLCTYASGSRLTIFTERA